MFQLRRNQVFDWHKQKLSPFLNIYFTLRCFSHSFAIANQLPGFSISRLANVEDFFDVGMLFKCKYKCEYSRLFIIFMVY